MVLRGLEPRDADRRRRRDGDERDRLRARRRGPDRRQGLRTPSPPRGSTGAEVDIYSENGTNVGYAYTDGAGNYTTTTGLPAGRYRARTNEFGYVGSARATSTRCTTTRLASATGAATSRREAPSASPWARRRAGSTSPSTRGVGSRGRSRTPPPPPGSPISTWIIYSEAGQDRPTATPTAPATTPRSTASPDRPLLRGDLPVCRDVRRRGLRQRAVRRLPAGAQRSTLQRDARRDRPRESTSPSTGGAASRARVTSAADGNGDHGFGVRLHADRSTGEEAPPRARTAATRWAGCRPADTW